MIRRVVRVVVVVGVCIVAAGVGATEVRAQLPILTRELQLQPAGAGNVTSITKAVNDGGLVVTNLPVTATLASPADQNVLVIGPSSNIVTQMALSTITQGTAWGLSGNAGGANAATIFLGTTDITPLVMKTDNTERMRIATTGFVGIGENAPGNVLHVTGGSSGQGLTIENTDGAATLRLSNNVNEQYTITQTGGANSVLEIGGASTVATVSAAGLAVKRPLLMDADPGADGEVLVSKGNNATPQWQSLSEAIGIRSVGRVQTGPVPGPPTPATEITVTDVPNLGANDAIIVTIEGSNSVVVPAITARTAGALGSFTITFSGSYTGHVNYMVIGQ